MVRPASGGMRSPFYIYPGEIVAYITRMKMETHMTPQARKALVAAYKERKTVAGVFAVICTATGESWVGTSRHVDTAQNGLWFALRQGGSPFRDLQAAWSANSEADFRFEQLDRLPEDISSLLRDMELKERARRWTARLGARAL